MKNIYLRIGLLVVIIFLVGFLAGKLITQPSSLQAADPKTQQISLNKDFSFPINDSSGKTLSQMTYTLVSVDKQKDIVVDGQNAHAVSGRTFLILEVKITNPTNQAVQVNSRDFVRISTGKNSELLAPDIYNDPITIQAISTKYTRLGIAIDEGDRYFTLHVGEIGGPKTEVSVNFPT